MKKSVERHFFLENGHKRIYCVEYIPAAELKRDLSVILCKPIWGERIRTHKIFTNLARTLMNLGFYVATCDYYGDGNSGGETKDLSFAGMVDDVQSLHAYLAKNSGIEKVAFVGLRLGANVAISVEPKIPATHKMILFEPVTDPIGVMKEWLRANLASQMATYKKIIKNREELVADMKNGLYVNIDGFVIGKAFWESFENISPFLVESNFSEPVSIYSITPAGRKGADFSELASGYEQPLLKELKREFIWNGWKKYVASPPLFFETVVAELTE